MSQFKETKLPCPACNSSDARAIYQSGVSICFSCGDITAPNAESSTLKPVKGSLPLVQSDPYNPVKRNISEDTARRYGYGLYQNDKGQYWQIAPYYDPATGQLVAQKMRSADKHFMITGDAKRMGLFGIQLARRGGKMIIITEGEIDAMSCSQAMGNTWPAVSLPNGAGNLQALKDSLEFLETYDKVVLAFDNDEAGNKATQAALELFSPGKVFTVALAEGEDPNAVLQRSPKELRTAIWEAKEYRPDGIVDLADMFEEISAPLEPGIPYPWPKLNQKLFGMRPGELITWTAGTGVGKTAIISELEYALVTAEERHIGVIHLEEGCVRTGRRMVGLALNKPIHLPGFSVPEAEFKAAFSATIGTRRVHAYNHFGSLDSDVLMNRVRYLVKAKGCEVIVLDHVSMVVSGADLSADERRMLDRVMTMLKSLTEETGAIIHVISHLSRQSGGVAHEEGRQVSLSHLRGTQAIGQLSDAVIAAERNQQASTERERNTTQLRVLKNRYAGLTGEADCLYYNQDTGRLEETEAVGEPVVNMGGDF